MCRVRATPIIGGFVIYRASHDDYQDNFLPTGLAGSTAENALDTACGLSLNDPPGREPGELMTKTTGGSVVERSPQIEG